MKISIKHFILLFSILLISITAVAQTSEDIEMAKKIAKSQGYSESEINAMIAKKGGEATKTVSTVNKVQRADTNKIQKTRKLDQNIEEKIVDSTKIEIYGHEIFQSEQLNFIPSYNIPTPQSYKISAGDEVVIDLWGGVYLNYTQTVSPEGSITIPDLGPVYLNGQTISQAEANLKIYLSKIYSGLLGGDANTFLRLSLGRMRSLTVNVVGDIAKPGTYTLPSLSNITSVLYLAGGPSDIGSVRDIKVYRNNKLIKTLDIYHFINKGDFSANIRLEDNDLIKVSTYINLVKISGNIKRPMYYEMREGESISLLLDYCGGFSKDANRQRVHITRVIGERRESFDVSSNEFGSFILKDGDEVAVSSNIEQNKNRVNIIGAVWHQGYYSISDTLSTLQQLIKVAGGVKEDAYMKQGYIERLDMTKKKVSLNFSIKEVIEGNEEIKLMPDDKVRLFYAKELRDSSTISSFGEFNKPGVFEFREGMTLSDIILLSGGFNNGASISNIDVARRNTLEGTISNPDTIARVFRFDLLNHPEESAFEMKPYDQVFVRHLPNYKKQQIITLTGEVLFPGEYVVENNIVRLSDVIKRAGGVTKDAYLKGGTVKRLLTDEEYERAQMAIDIAKKQTDSIMIEDLKRDERYTVSADFISAISDPGSYSDLVLHQGDIVTIPKLNNTVKVSGGVLFSNVLTYDPKLSPRDYINKAGGYSKNAIRGSTYIVYINGSASSKRGSGFEVEPGCEIIVPIKDITNERRISATEVMSIASSTASVAAMVVSMVNALK